MPPSDIDVDTQSATTTRSFPEWTQEDDSDIDIASIAERQRLRFRAASVAGRQRYQSPPREPPSMLTRRDVSQEAHGIRAILEERKLGNFAKGLGSAVADVAEGLHDSGNAAKSAFALGGGIGDAANAAVGSIADGIGKGVNAVASALGGSDSESSEHEHKTKTKPPKNDPPPPTQEPPPPAQTSDPPQVTSDPPQVTSDPPQTTAAPPPPPPPPPKETKPPPPPPISSDKKPDPPKTTDKPIDNIPPPKAEQPSSETTDDPSSTDSSSTTSKTSSKDSPDASPTSTDEDQKISLSVIVPGATVTTTQSGTRLLLTPVLSSALPAITSGAKKGTSSGDYFSTTPFAVAPGPTTMLTSVSRTSSLGSGQSVTPYPDTTKPEPSGQGGDGQGGSRGGLSPGQGAAVAMGVLVCVCSLAAVGFYFWRTRKQQRDPASGGDRSFSSLFRPPLDKAKRGLANVASKIPYVRDRFYKNDSWKSLGDPYGDFFAEKMTSSATSASAGPAPTTADIPKLAPITVQTTFTRESSIISQFNRTAAVGGTVSSVGVSTMGVSSLGVSPVAEISTRAAAMGPSAVGKHLVAAPASSTTPSSTSPFEAPGDVPANDAAAKPAHIASQVRQLVGTNHGPKPSFSSITPQYNLTLPSTFGARRISDLSSLSSGFGDGDIVVPSSRQQSRKSTTSSKLQNVTNMTAENEQQQQQRNRHSTATTVNSNGSARRDTVYTEASEDSPPRFRTVSSWVRQQTGRVKREEQRQQDAADETGTPPPVPAIPPEQEFRLMMPDGEEPRRVEDTNAGNGSTGDWGSQTKNMLSGVIGTAR
ncbi:hypothetical protein LEL_02331 [Akanthomyces lecanii RCEF 1005]|uniref:Uncharacterized protein n=1 Tax=Akanthomyces lecanii RCEF 1005 TaxID=1081108 RepID=A0A162IVU0_CORDF|nr:hypothetical protein LEL_02331 [Akanthomyces lecanii RCEF 1005]